MPFELREAKREETSLLIGVAGASGAGKTESAMRLATGLAGGKKFTVIDTEARRALHKADDYNFAHIDFQAPFSPERYAEAMRDADAAGHPVIVVDSASHEYESEGGVLDIQEEEWVKLMKGDESRREITRASSWITPKRRHKKGFVQPLLQLRAHVILCFRAEDKIEFIKEGGKTVVRAKQTLTGLDGWVPICERRLPFELLMSLMLTPDAPGIPKPIKFDKKRHGPLVPLDQELSEEVGVALAEWARGEAPAPLTTPRASAVDRKRITDKAAELGLTRDDALTVIAQTAGVTKTADIPADKVADVLAALEETRVPA